MNAELKRKDAVAIAAAVRAKEVTARTVIEAHLNEIAARNGEINCFTHIGSEQALKQAERLDRAIERGEEPGCLAGVPFAVKNLFDIAGITTLAGAKINAENPPAVADATAIAKLKQAGAILVGALNMDEYAYGFVTENHHYGTTRNPRDLTRIAGGSSGGSAAAVAAGLLPLTLGSDTNGSIRVPAALCGIYGLKPTFGRISRAGAFPLSSSLDTVGPLARSVRDIATSFDLLQGADTRDPVCTLNPPEPCLAQLNLGIEGLRLAVAGNYFARGADIEALEAVLAVAGALGVRQSTLLPEADRARAAAYVITAAEGANLHLGRLRSRPQDFDPATRDRFLAGAAIPATWYIQAQRFRRWFRDRVSEIFESVDILIAPTTPCVAPPIGQETVVIAGEEVPVRANLGQFTQPLSFIGLPVLSVPILRPNALPLGVQLVAAPYNEALLLRVAAFLEEQGVVGG